MKRLGPALAVRDFRLWWLALIGMDISLQMLEVAIGWEVYTQHHNVLDLGWIGLAEFVPMFVLALPAGHLADRLPRRLVFACSLLVGVGVGVGLAALSGAGDTTLAPYLALAVGAGITMALGTPAARAMPPTLVSAELLRSAMTLRSIATQMGQVVLEGLRFVGRTQILLGAILLDLLAVLFGGAVALLPVFASTILHVGPTGLGVLRAAPAVGALLAAAILTRRPLLRHAGRTLLTVVALYGASMIVFGLSRSYPLSLLALGVSGFVDLFSMNIRATIVALATPDRLRGRVGAVEMVFISASNQLGAFESGLAASLIGVVPAVVGGGAVTILLALGWSRAFGDLAHVDRMQDIEPAPTAVLEGAGAPAGL
jgi:hypothetical protein